MATNKFPAQAETIERVRAILNLSNDALAREVAVRPETMQKYAAGYQKAGDKLMRMIARLPELRGDASANLALAGAGQPLRTLLSRDVKLEPPSTQDQLSVVLKEGTLDEVRLLRQVVETIFRQVEVRRLPTPVPIPAIHPRGPLVFDRRPRLLPALGYIPAGWPQESIAQQASQFVVVPEDDFPDADYALQVHGDSMIDAEILHGDWVVMTTRREPRSGNVVAAMIDGATTLKTYLLDDARRPFLRSENCAYPSRIDARDELQIQGVMLGKLTGPAPRSATAKATAEPPPF